MDDTGSDDFADFHMLRLRDQTSEDEGSAACRCCDIYTGRSVYQCDDGQAEENLKSMETEDMKIIVSVKNGRDDQQAQNETVEEMIDAGCDILCINLVDRTAPSRIIKLAKQNHIPVIFFNREPVREDLLQWEDLYYVGCEAEQSGIMQGDCSRLY